jgi:PleD family two-component response regulator
MNLRILLVEGQAEEALFLKDVLADMNGDLEDRRQPRPWGRLDLLHAQCWEDAEALLATEVIDVVLLNPDLPDSQGFDTFRKVQLAAPQVPVILLLGIGDEPLGIRMVREGAQDFLIRALIDCGPMAHALRTAMERHRLLSATQAASLRDPLTGVGSSGFFAIMAERDRKLAAQLDCPWVVLVAEPRDISLIGGAQGEQHRDLRLVETAEVLRQAAGSCDLVYRIGANRFAITLFLAGVRTPEDLERAISRQRISVGKATFSLERSQSLDALLAEAAEDLESSAARKPQGEAGILRAKHSVA